MTRTSTVLLLIISLALGCTSDPMGLRTSYRDRNVPPSANTTPYSNPPIATQPGVQLGQPIGVSQSMPYGQQRMMNLAVAPRQNPWNSPYPMLASSGGQIDGRSFPYLNRAVKIPGPGGARAIKRTASSTQLAGGVNASPQEDLRYRGGHTIKDLKYVNIFVGGNQAWDANDWKSIDKALAAAMADRRLNNMIMQYFNNQPVSATFQGSFFLNGWKPSTVQKTDMTTQIQSLYSQKAFDGQDLPNTVFNFLLPRGTILGDPSGGAQQKVSNKAIPLADAEDSTGGLGGYHGSVHVGGKTVYYAVGAYSERLPSGGTNGIPVFKDANWKNVVATFYHELQEARTDADVDDAQTGGMTVLGWTSDDGNEIGDYPIAEATQLLQVFQEIPLADGSGTVPVQFCYSNAVHGPEGPIDYPHGMEPAPGSQPANNPPQNNPPPNNSPPSNNNPPNNSVPNNNPANPLTGLPQDLQSLISSWGQLDDYIKKAILKLAS